MTRIAVIAAVALALVADAFATHPDEFRESRVNLDADRRLEVVRLNAGHFATAAIVDRCGGVFVFHRVFPTLGPFFRSPLPRADVVEVDAASPQPEVVASYLSTGGEVGWVAVVQLAPRAGRCARLRRLLTLDTRMRPLRTDPAFRRTALDAYALQTDDTPPLEIAVVENWTRREGARQRRVTVFGYSKVVRQYTAIRSDPPVDVSP